MSNKKTIAIAYIPVFHRGYREFTEKAKSDGAEHLYIVGDEFLRAHEELDYLNRKDRLRAVPQSDMVRALTALELLPVSILDLATAEEIAAHGWRVIMPNEDISILLKEKYFGEQDISLVDTFLRWHRDNTGEEKAVAAAYEVTEDALPRAIMKDVEAEASKSVDWWRQIGAALVKDGKVIACAHNVHEPKEDEVTTIGDPRSLAHRGTAIEVSVATHAEGALIAEAARKGTPLLGAELYVTDFPCPYCARIIAHSGIKKVFFKKGYALLDGDAFLREAGVELVRVT